MKGTEKAAIRVVARLRDGKALKGYTDALPVTDLQALIDQHPLALPKQLGLCLAESSKIVSLPLESLKALFFVKTFEGRKEYNEIKFFQTHPPIEGLWVRVKFYDDETLEGVVRNSLHHLVDPGFFVKPPDPAGNNQIIFVVKASLAEFRVLGVKMTY